MEVHNNEKPAMNRDKTTTNFPKNNSKTKYQIAIKHEDLIWNAKIKEHLDLLNLVAVNYFSPMSNTTKSCLGTPYVNIFCFHFIKINATFQ